MLKSSVCIGRQFLILLLQNDSLRVDDLLLDSYDELQFLYFTHLHLKSGGFGGHDSPMISLSLSEA